MLISNHTLFSMAYLNMNPNRNMKINVISAISVYISSVFISTQKKKAAE